MSCKVSMLGVIGYDIWASSDLRKLIEMKWSNQQSSLILYATQGLAHLH